MKTFKEFLNEANHKNDMTIKKSDIPKIVKQALDGDFIELGGPWALAYLTKGKSVVLFNNMSQAIDTTNPQRVTKILQDYFLVKESRDKTKLKGNPIFSGADNWYISVGSKRYFYYGETGKWGLTGKANIPMDLYDTLEEVLVNT